MQIITRLENLPPGKVIPFEVYGSPALLINDGKQIRAFQNLCPHRGGPLIFDEASGTLRCQWHHSTWSLTGDQLSPPEVEGKIDYQHLTEEEIVCLIPVEIEIRDGYIWGPG
ncbi:MAG: Rieske 2Fe-2S domain-containing protein [Anaerolineales bacterium]